MKAQRLEALRSICLSCRNCVLCQERKKMVFGEGGLDARVFFVGEGPGKEEDESGRPFVGRSGNLLRQLITAIDLDLEKDVFIGNVVKCRPPANRVPRKEEIEQCSKFLFKQIEIVSPKILVLLGRSAVKCLFPEHTETPLEILRKETKKLQIVFQGVPVLITYHPSALLRDPSRKIGTGEDFKFLSDLGKS